MTLPPLRIGIAGYGGFGRFLHHSWNALEGVNVTAAATLHEHPPNIRIYEHWEGLITDREVDLVAIATPPNLHAAIAGAMMESGKHVLIEKPVATALADARRLLDIRDRTGKVATIDFLMRFTPIVEALVKWKTEQPFGQLRRVVIENHALDDSLPTEHWFWDPAQSGGILVEHAVHFFDLINAITNAKPVEVHGASHSRTATMEDRVLATVCYDDGMMATQYHTFSRPTFFERTTIRLWYDLAEVECLGWFPLSGKIYALTHAGTELALAELPNFHETARRDIPGRGEVKIGSVRIGGRPLPASHEIEGTFEIRRPKMDIYADGVRAMLNDLRLAMVHSGHHLRVPLEAGIESLQLALEASQQAHSRSRDRHRNG